MMNPEIYKDPQVWDPTRYLPDRAEDKSGQHVWVGWGCGKHPCRGMRVRCPRHICCVLCSLTYNPFLTPTSVCEARAEHHRRILRRPFRLRSPGF